MKKIDEALELSVGENKEFFGSVAFGEIKLIFFFSNGS
jgi:hypothetical protein